MFRYASAAFALTLAAGPVVADDKPVSFVADVAPVLKEHCFACHNPKKASGKYDMTTFARLTAGGSSGPGIVSGKAAESEFHQLLVTADERRMPPRDKGSAVPAAAAAVIARWIDQGAKPDAELDVKADLTRELRKRWQPPVLPARYSAPVPVRAVGFTPDDKSLVVSGYHELLVYDVATLTLTKRVRTRAERAHAFAFLADGTLAVAGGRPGLEGDVRVYDLSAKGAKAEDVTNLDGVTDPKVRVATLLEADDEVLALAVTPDGGKLAAGGTDRVVWVWDVSKGAKEAKLLHTVENHADWVLGVAFGPDARTLFTASRDKTAKVWNLQKSEPVVTFQEHRDTVTGVAVAADGKAGCSAGADGQVRLWEAAGDGRQLKLIGGHPREVLKLVAHPPRQLLVTSSADGTVQVWNREAKAITLGGLTAPVLSLAVSTDGKLIAAGTHTGAVALWPTDQARPRGVIDVRP